MSMRKPDWRLPQNDNRRDDLHLFSPCSLVNVATMSHSHHANDPVLIVDFIQDAVIAHPDSPNVIGPREPLATWWSRIVR